MSHRLGFRTALALVAVLPAAASAQVASHLPGAEWGEHMVPGWVLMPPPFHLRSIEATPPPEAVDAQYFSSGSRGAALVPAEAREAIRMAEGGRWAEAAEAGQALLRKPVTEFNDYTWDYVANATAWALIQAGRPKEASEAHLAAAARIRDQDAKRAHRFIAVALQKSKKPADKLKDAKVYRAEIRAHLAGRIEQFTKLARAARKSTTADLLMPRLKQAYGLLRELAAADPALGEELKKKDFIPAADTLVHTVIPQRMNNGRRIVKRLQTEWGERVPQRDYAKWNVILKALWRNVRETKRLCRIHHYMAGSGLASPGQARKLFREAHGLLFVPTARNLVWQPVGMMRVVNDIPQKDLRRRVPWEQTPIVPLDVALAKHTNQSDIGWKKLDRMDSDDFKTMDGGEWNTMEGGGWNKMEGGGWNKMDGGGWNKMEGGAWQRR